MSNYRRDYAYGGTYFITAVLQDRRCDWLVRYIHEFREAYRETLRHCPFETVAVTVLPDHFHLVLRLPENRNDFSRIVQVLKTNFSKRLPDSCRHPNASQKGKREAGIWQRRFWEHKIRDDADLERHVFYTYFNPVKHGLVRQVRDWPHSSFHRDVQNGLFPADWGGCLSENVRNLYHE